MEQFAALIGRMSWLEAAGLVTGLAAVWLLIRQNVWTWPLGVAYVVISLWVFWTAKLYADLVLHVVYLGLNLYGWWYWVRGGVPSGADEVPVTRAPPSALAALIVVSLAATALAGFLFARYTDASLPYWDNATTMLSFAGMWLTSRKKIESWWIWLVVDVMATGIYLYKGIAFYALLYLIYCGLAVVGWLAWRRTLESTPSGAASCAA